MFVTSATAADVPAIVALVNGAYRGPSAEQGWTHEAGLLGGQRTDASAIAAALAGGSTVLLMRDRAEAPLAGCVSIEPKGASGTWYLGMLTIDPARQADGLGRRLLTAGEDHAREHGASRVELTVIRQRQALIAWYERRGYVRTGATAPFPYDDERFGQPLRDDLVFVVLDKAI